MQKLFTNFKAAVDSFPLGEQQVGLLKPGRYTGFDIIQSTGPLTILLSHSDKVKKTGTDNLFKANYGSLLLPTGIVVHDDTDIELIVDTNLGNSNARIDYVICEHDYQPIEGGTVAQYSLIKGPNDGTEPTLTNPATQVLLGKLTIQAEGYNFSHITYIPEMVKLLGDLSYTDLATWVNEVVIFPTQYLVPQKGIIMFNGVAAEVPEGWNLCDGTNGTPDLRDRFVVSTGIPGTGYALGASAGSNSVTLTGANLPATSYTATTSSDGSHNHSATMDPAGAHTHTATLDSAGNHNHGWTGSLGDGNPDGSGDTTTPGSWAAYVRGTYINNQGAHSHNASISTSGTHSHNMNLTNSGTHTHTVTVGPLGSATAIENRPPYYALAFIMKL